MNKEAPFIVGAAVEVRPDELPRLLKTVARRVTGRTGIVKRCFVPMGAREWRVSVQWLSKNGISTLGQLDYWNDYQLQVKESP